MVERKRWLLLSIKFKDNRPNIQIQKVDGGGIFIGENSRYEVHMIDADGNTLCEYQDEILSITDERGKEVDWGNPYFPGHPHSDIVYERIRGAHSN